MKAVEPQTEKITPLSYERLITLPLVSINSINNIFGLKETSDINEKLQNIIEASKKGTPKNVEAIINAYSQRRAYVTIDYTRTISPQKFEPIKLGGGVSIPVDYTPEELNQAMKIWRETFLEMKELVDKEAKSMLS